jgi:hypothetical protein
MARQDVSTSDVVSPGAAGTRANAPTSGSRTSATILGAAFVALAVLLAAGMWSVATFGGIEPGLALLAGERLYLPRQHINVGEISVGRTVSVELAVQNVSSEELTVLGAETGCSCAVTSGLPLTPRSSGRIEVHMTPYARDAGQAFERQIELFLDREPQRVYATISGRVVR